MNHIIQTSAKHLVDGDLFVDDSVPNVNSWQKHRPNHAFLWSAAWNANEDDSGVRVDSWNTLRTVAKRIARIRYGCDPYFTSAGLLIEEGLALP